jgi:hypothetical protein
MPPSLRPPATTSFGHFSPAATPAASRTAARAATPAAMPNWGSAAGAKAGGGRSRTETASDVRGGVSQGDLPARPRPAVWASATTTVPSGAPAAARSRAASLVEGVLSR